MHPKNKDDASNPQSLTVRLGAAESYKNDPEYSESVERSYNEWEWDGEVDSAS